MHYSIKAALIERGVMNFRFLSSFSGFIEKHSSGWKIFFYTLASILISASMQFLEQLIPVAAGQKLPLKMDFRPFFSPQELVDVFQFYGEVGRNLYFWQDVLDMFLPIAVCFMIASFYTRTAIRFKLPVSFNVLPFGFLVFDWIENSLMFYFLSSWPIVPYSLATFTGRITAIKLTFVFIGYGMLIASLVSFFLSFVARKIFGSKERV